MFYECLGQEKLQVNDEGCSNAMQLKKLMIPTMQQGSRRDSQNKKREFNPKVSI